MLDQDALVVLIAEIKVVLLLHQIAKQRRVLQYVFEIIVACLQRKIFNLLIR